MFKSKVSILLLLLLLVPKTGMTAVEDRDLISRSIATHTHVYNQDITSNALLVNLASDITEFGAEFAGLGFLKDARAINRILSLDLAVTQKQSIAPYFAQMCNLIDQGSPDAVELATVYMEAVRAEEQVTENALSMIFADLSETGKEAILDYSKQFTSYKPVTKVDWVGIARDVPDYTIFVMRNGCENFRNPSAARAKFEGFFREIQDNLPSNSNWLLD